ncbi:MAG: twin-arginine translocation signal domain-containing protein [Gemmataceae bacterium]
MPSRRRFLQASLVAGAALGLPAALLAKDAEPETLYNGIRLPSPWPPRIKDVPRDPVTPPYITTPPAVIPIDVGRQLFVDDFLIARTTLTRTHHLPEQHPRNPVGAGGMVFSDGVWHDPADRLFKMWYLTKGGTAYATSKDGIAWDKPNLDVRKGTNLVQTSPRDSSTVWLDLLEKDPKRRFKMFRSYSRPEIKSWCLWVHFSGDGIHWTDGQPTGSCGDRTTVFFNPFRGVWVYSLRHGWGRPRRRRYWETRDDVIKGAQWGAVDRPPMWCGADNLDPARPDYKVTPELYNLDCVAYESILLGLFTIWRGQFPGREKPNEVCVGYSRDGWHFSRPDRRGFFPISERKGDWNYSNVQSCGGGCLVVNDKLYFYCSGRGTGHVTALATLRRDGFTSLDAGKTEGALTTRPVRFRGRHCFVNVDAPKGDLRLEILDRDGNVIAPFSRANCTPIRADSVAHPVHWKGADDLAKLAGQPVQFRFHLTGGKLYAFWVTPEATGASHGYIAAGGPGFDGLTDTAGMKR